MHIEWAETRKMVALGHILLSLPALVSAWSPTDSYAPGIVDCPAYLNDSSYSTDNQLGFIRAATNISSKEVEWMSSRDNITNENLRWFLELANMTDFDTGSYLDQLSTLSKSNTSVNANPRIALAFSGGGYRAMINAAGQISGLDNRTDGALDHGLPILQSASYVAGLSGGSWFLSTLAFNNWTSVQEIVDNAGKDDAIWDLDHSIISPGGINIFKTGYYWYDINEDLDAKKEAGFNISLTDPWGRGLSYQFFPGLKDKGASMTFSSLRDFPVFKNHTMPFPLVVADGRRPGTYVIGKNSTIFEFNPFEMGSWDPSLYSFTDLKYVGTNTKKGFPSNGSCIAGFDNAGFVFGTSSTLFNQILLQLNTTGLSGTIYNLIESFLENLSDDEDDIAEWRPNPFYDSPWGDSDNLKNNKSLYLVDGGEDGQNIPLYPLIQPERKVDVIFAYDNSMDTNYSWPDGYSLVQSYERQFGSESNGTAFPYVPDTGTFLKENLTAKPTFFGCYSDNLTSLMDSVGADYTPPLIVYTANRPFTYNSNTSTYKMSYETDQMLAMIENGFAVSTRKNLTLDDEWRACVGCAILQRSRERLGLSMGTQCKKCFDKYCWDGTVSNSSDYLPDSFTNDGEYVSNSTEDESSSTASSDQAPESTSAPSSRSKGGAGNVMPQSVGTILSIFITLLCII
ncbi:PLB1 [Brettanomyces bruxellensis]|uniref:Lysophospholipase n=1 Tax=Dekkera bruxellensis TaxID=5007 RepID=A0A7D9D237_DEKBR|nr:PLB1 [Brettanomyces bruxellensis]